MAYIHSFCPSRVEIEFFNDVKNCEFFHMESTLIWNFKVRNGWINEQLYFKLPYGNYELTFGNNIKYIIMPALCIINNTNGILIKGDTFGIHNWCIVCSYKKNTDINIKSIMFDDMCIKVEYSNLFKMSNELIVILVDDYLENSLRKYNIFPSDVDVIQTLKFNIKYMGDPSSPICLLSDICDDDTDGPLVYDHYVIGFKNVLFDKKEIIT